MARRVDVGKIRREEIVEAAVEIIAEQGIQNLSLSAIEQKAEMSRGQLTYYFAAKEDILLAVFDRLIRMMHERAQTDQREGTSWIRGGTGWERLQCFLSAFLLHPPEAKVFGSLQYTFLSQMAHREDFRTRLADLYEVWRGRMAQDVEEALSSRPDQGGVSARTIASFVQALIHGLSMQRAADPESYDPAEMLKLCMELLGTYLGQPTTYAGPVPPFPPSPEVTLRTGTRPGNPEGDS